MLEINNINVQYGGLVALEDVSIQIKSGQLVSVIGANGAGKTTLFKALSGIIECVCSKLDFDGRDILNLRAPDRAALGIAHVPEGRQIFKSMSIAENFQMGAYRNQAREHLTKNLDLIYTLFPSLYERRNDIAGALSGGQQQMVAIGRGLASNPKLLLLDEPSMGLAPTVVEQIFESIIKLHKDSNLTILLVEQRAAEALESCHYGYVLESGRIVLEGFGHELITNTMVRNAYLGSSS